MRINEDFLEFDSQKYEDIDYLAENYDVNEDEDVSEYINEMLGSMQIPDNSPYVKFIDGIISDLKNRLYKNKIVYKQTVFKSPIDKLKYIKSFDFQIFKNFEYANSYYIKEYTPSNLDWLGKLYIVVIDSYPTNKIEAMAMTSSDVTKSYSKDKIVFATICVINAATNPSSITKVYHEMSHLYKDWKETMNSSKYEQEELRNKISRDIISHNKFFKHRNILSTFDDEQFVKYLKDVTLKDNPTTKDIGAVVYSLFYMMYFLNKSEMSAHIEDVVRDLRDFKRNHPIKEITFKDLFDASITLRAYMGIKNVLTAYTENVNSKVINALEYYCKDLILDVYYAYNKREHPGTVGNIFKHVSKKLFDKIDVFIRRIYKQISHFNNN